MLPAGFNPSVVLGIWNQHVKVLGQIFFGPQLKYLNWTTSILVSVFVRTGGHDSVSTVMFKSQEHCLFHISTLMFKISKDCFQAQARYSCTVFRLKQDTDREDQGSRINCEKGQGTQALLLGFTALWYFLKEWLIVLVGKTPSFCPLYKLVLIYGCSIMHSFLKLWALCSGFPVLMSHEPGSPIVLYHL